MNGPESVFSSEAIFLVSADRGPQASKSYGSSSKRPNRLKMAMDSTVEAPETGMEQFVRDWQDDWCD
jgi:hypothetical protein